MAPATVDLTNWKVTLPTGSKGHPDEVSQPRLATFEDSPWLVRYCDKIRFRANCGGVTTSGSSYPRCELREMNGSKLASWSNKSGTHTMSVTAAVMHLPVKKPHVVVAQIHDAEDDVLMVRLEGSHLFVEAGGKDVGLLDRDYRLGDVFKVTIQATKSGITVYYAKSLTASRVKVKYKKTGSGLYFKAGCYTQSNVSKGDKADAYGEVDVYALTVTHS